MLIFCIFYFINIYSLSPQSNLSLIKRSFFEWEIQGKSLLFKALAHDNYQEANQLLNQGKLDFESYHLMSCLGYPWENMKSFTSLFDVSQCLNDGIIYPYVRKRPFSICEKDMTALYRAVQNNHKVLAVDMIESGVSVDTNTLHLIVAKEDIDLLKLANPNSCQVNSLIKSECLDLPNSASEKSIKSSDKTLLLRALERGNVELIQFLIQRSAVVYSLNTNIVTSLLKTNLNTDWLKKNKSIFFNNQNPQLFFIHGLEVEIPHYYELLYHNLIYLLNLENNQGAFLKGCFPYKISQLEKIVLEKIGFFEKKRKEVSCCTGSCIYSLKRKKVETLWEKAMKVVLNETAQSYINSFEEKKVETLWEKAMKVILNETEQSFIYKDQRILNSYCWKNSRFKEEVVEFMRKRFYRTFEPSFQKSNLLSSLNPPLLSSA